MPNTQNSFEYNILKYLNENIEKYNIQEIDLRRHFNEGLKKFTSADFDNDLPKLRAANYIDNKKEHEKGLGITVDGKIRYNQLHEHIETLKSINKVADKEKENADVTKKADTEKKPENKTLFLRWKEKLENNRITASVLLLAFLLTTVATVVKNWKDLFPPDKKEITAPPIEININIDSPTIKPPVLVKEKFHVTKLLPLTMDQVKSLENLTGMEFVEEEEGKELSIKIISGGLVPFEFPGEETIFRVTGGSIEVTINGVVCCTYPNAFPSIKRDMTEPEATTSMWTNINNHLKESTDLIQNISQCLKK